ncbi:MAG: hypothetical protein IPK83_10370 [Planctomycetes bacterium]|nr:hypothetical protein [Planctomycetota bacterium]
MDEEGQPVPNEEYEIKAPDGKTIKSGRLNQLGQAHVSIPDPGNCQISFPNLDRRAWGRPGEKPSTGAAPATAAVPPPPMTETAAPDGSNSKDAKSASSSARKSGKQNPPGSPPKPPAGPRK